MISAKKELRHEMYSSKENEDDDDEDDDDDDDEDEKKIQLTHIHILYALTCSKTFLKLLSYDSGT